MDLGELRKYINYIANKEQMGEPLSPDNYNILLSVSSDAYFDIHYKDVVGILSSGSKELSAKLFYNTPLGRFVVTGGISPATPPPSGLVSKPANYFKFINGNVTVSGKGIRKVDYLSNDEFDDKRFDILARSVKRTPIITELGINFKVVPNDFASLNYNYLRKPVSPKYDYCIGVDDDEEYYMPAGSVVKADGGHYSLYDASGIKMVDNVVHLTAAAYPYTSVSVELDYDDQYVSKIGDLIISLASIRSRELNVAQIAQQE